MKENIDIYTTSLVHAIRDSKEYKEFCFLKNKLSDKPDLKRQINEYRKENFRLQNYEPADTLFQAMEEFQKKNQELLKNPLVSQYLKAELAICRMLQKISSAIVESVDLDLDEVAKGIRERRDRN